MATEQEKRIKNEFKKKAQEKPEKYYPVKALIEHGFKRYKCKVCGNYFWSCVERSICGDPNCIGEYQFIGKKIIKPLCFPEVWQRFSKFLEKFGYTPISRYPVVARWREDLFFVEASIDDFIPYVLEGVSEPIANPLTVPQFCLRFNDIDNVGVTGRHYTGFVMIGQHAFEKPANYKPEEYLEHIYLWLTEELKIPEESIQFHEDAWAGSGKLGPSMEYFSHGLELGNQVYMQFDISTGQIRELPLKVLDMGMGQERYVWFSNGTSTSYECVMPTVVKKLFSITGIKKTELFEKFLPYSGKLNLDEVVDIDIAWKEIAKILHVDVKTLKEEVYPLTALFAIAEHTRTLLVALHDGALPSNVGGGYNLRVILRRCFNFIEKFSWDIELEKIFEEHAKYLKPQYPELSENLEEIYEIINHERKKYAQTKKKAKEILSKLRKEDITKEKMIELYDSHGITPEELKEKFWIEIPKDFYKLVTEKHGKTEIMKEKRLPKVENIITEKLYYQNDKIYEFEAKVLKIIDNWVVLDRTAFYPRGGGQEPDFGKINQSNVIDVEQVGNAVLHKVDKITFEEGDIVKCVVNKERRERIKAHHTAVHILNGACRKILGNHVWQAGSYKDDKKARLDITHYKTLSREEIEKIEKLCNEIVSKNIKVEKLVLPRSKAESLFGFRLYQGGAVPGREIRIIKINNFDVEACGGLHADNTAEIQGILITNVSKIQDAVIRIELVAGKALQEFGEFVEKRIEKLKEILNCSEEDIVAKVNELLNKKEKLEKELKKKVKEKLNEIAKKTEFEIIGNIKLYAKEVEFELKEMKEFSRRISAENTVVVLLNKKGFIFASAGNKTGIDIGALIRKICEKFNGKGGGSKIVAQGFVKNKEGVLECIKEELKKLGKS
ncbi:MAG TPA: alanine--tRNA ligase [Nanoarchaeota archaeon]|nr:alanine--tRNA ligase [Nanoarchaeota archaeon]